MTVTSVHKDPEARTMTLTAEFDVSVDRVWQLWSDPRQLERWWGPPMHPLTVVDHDLSPGGKVSYFVTGPEGGRISGWWHILVVDAPHRLQFEMGGPDIPTLTVRVRVDKRPADGTRMVLEAAFPSSEAMDQLILMGFVEGMSTAVGQIDAVLGTGA